MKKINESEKGFAPLRDLLDIYVSKEDYAAFRDYAEEFGYDFDNEDPNSLWPEEEISQLVDAFENGEDFGGYFGDSELHNEYDDNGDINVETAYSEWIKSFAPNYDVSNVDAYLAGLELAGGAVDESALEEYDNWVESKAPNYDISNYDAFLEGFKSVAEMPIHEAEDPKEVKNINIGEYVADHVAENEWKDFVKFCKRKQIDIVKDSTNDKKYSQRELTSLLGAWEAYKTNPKGSVTLKETKGEPFIKSLKQLSAYIEDACNSSEGFESYLESKGFTDGEIVKIEELIEEISVNFAFHSN